MADPCYLCNLDAHDPRGGTAYYRFYNLVDERWDSLAICPVCLTKLKGPKFTGFIVKDLATKG
jgi:hypothetical protein